MRRIHLLFRIATLQSEKGKAWEIGVINFKSYRILRLFFVGLCSVTAAHASAGEVFECRDFDEARENPRAKVLVVATINDDGKTGEIRAAGVTQEAKYSVVGLNRVWKFAGKFTLSVEPNGHALSASEYGGNIQRYRCTKAE